MFKKTAALTLLLFTLVISPAHAGNKEATPSDLDARRKTLDSLIHEQWEHYLRVNPEFASILGDKRYNDHLTDFSQAAVDANQAANRAFLKRVQAIDSHGFSVQEKLNKDLMARQLTTDIEETRLQYEKMAILPNSGLHLQAPQWVTVLSFVTVKDYEDYLARLKQLPRAFAQSKRQMQEGVRLHLVPPQFLLPKIAVQCEDIAALAGDASPFAQPLAKFPADFSDADKQRLRSAILDAISQDVVPAYKQFAAFVRDEYVPRGRKNEGIWSLPNGVARYQFSVKSNTTTNFTPEYIHQLGLREVARIEGEMQKTAKKLGFADLKSFNASLATNPDLHPKSRQEIIDLYNKYIAQMYPKLPQLFGRLPKAQVVTKEVEHFREKSASGASYQRGTPDGTRPGHIMVNTGDFANRLTLSIETTAVHEGVPGHHMQISIAQELPDLPPFRKQGGYNAYIEGWALYAERLGGELGAYQEPYSYYGHLQDEMLRAIRLVVDTGLHYKKWKREQVVDFFRAHSAIEDVDVQSETDRYIVWPGQALGYKIGQIKLIALRQYAMQRLGKKFDVRAFHDEVLGGGALPLDVLEQRMHAWVAMEMKKEVRKEVKK